jgi:hypothetical protein
MTFKPDLSGTSIGAGGRPKPIKMKPIVSEEMAAMRDWCMGQTGVAQGETTVLLHVSHSNLKKTFFQEIRLDMHMSVLNVKHKLEFHTGTSAVNNTVLTQPQSRASPHPAPYPRIRAQLKFAWVNACVFLTPFAPFPSRRFTSWTRKAT